MRALILAGVTLFFATAGACASSEDEPSAPPPHSDSGPPPPPVDAGSSEAAPEGPDASNCSAAGWCVTPLPEADFTLTDVWPHPGHAFAVAESPTAGVKVLEWRDSESKWSYIDDNSQNESGRGKFIGKMWSPNDDEVYFTVAPRIIYHGTRSKDGTGAWSWTSQQLEDRVLSYPMPEDDDHYRGRPRFSNLTVDYRAFGVFGTSADDVYAWFANTIYHLTSTDGGPPTWQVEYMARDRDSDDEQIFFLGAAATSKDDVWFVGGRGGDPEAWVACGVIVRKTKAAGYQRIADGVRPIPYACEPRTDVPMIGGKEGWLSDIHAMSSSELVALKGARDVVRISVSGDSYSVALSTVPEPLSRKNLTSLWSAPGDGLWLGGYNLVLHGDDIWDGGTFGISTIALNGAWLTFPVYQVRSSSNVDRWAVGARYALHKTTP